jgi:hypothetical protein
MFHPAAHEDHADAEKVPSLLAICEALPAGYIAQLSGACGVC